MNDRDSADVLLSSWVVNTARVASAANFGATTVYLISRRQTKVPKSCDKQSTAISHMCNYTMHPWYCHVAAYICT